MTEVCRSRRLYETTREIVFSEAQDWDATERLSLLTVAVGLRRAALFVGLEASNLRDLRATLINNNYLTLLSRGSQEKSVKPENYPEEIVKVFVLIQKASAMSRKTEPALWVFLDQADRASVKKGEVDSPGVLLDYPECCLAARRLRIKMMSEAYLDGLVKAVGLDSKAIAKAVVKNEKVEIDCPWLDAAVASDTKSRGRFPFVLHHACSNCLESANSPSARLNDVYEEIALKISPELHERLRDSDATSQSCDEHS